MFIFEEPQSMKRTNCALPAADAPYPSPLDLGPRCEAADIEDESDGRQGGTAECSDWCGARAVNDVRFQ